MLEKLKEVDAKLFLSYFLYSFQAVFQTAGTSSVRIWHNFLFSYPSLKNKIKQIKN